MTKFDKVRQEEYYKNFPKEKLIELIAIKEHTIVILEYNLQLAQELVELNSSKNGKLVRMRTV